MKSERRHDLETNDLAVRLNEWIDKIRPHFGQIGGVIAAFLVVFALWSAWRGSTSALEQRGWDAYMLASYSADPELLDMKRLAENDEFQGTAVVEWAYLTWCDRQMLLASNAYLIDRKAALSRLRQIEGIYSSLSTGASNALLRNQATYGLAQVYEMQDKPEKARAEYLKVSGDLAALAAERAKQLESNRVQEYCNWLASAELPTRASSNSSTSSEMNRPSFDVDIPSSPSSPQGVLENKTLEEILTGGSSADDENRYGEQDENASGPSSESNQDSSSDVEPADKPERQSKTPADEPSAL